jgi:hypothetical protein
MNQIFRSVDWQAWEQMERRVDKEVCAIDKDERRIRRKSWDDRVDGRVGTHLGGIDNVLLTPTKRESL